MQNNSNQNMFRGSRVFRAVLALVFILSLASCFGGGHRSYYKPVGLAPESYIALEKGEKPKLIRTKDIDMTLQTYKDRGYVVLGRSDFESREKKQYFKIRIFEEDYDTDARGQGIHVGATHVLYQRTLIEEYDEWVWNDGKSNTERYEKYSNISVFLAKAKPDQ